MKRKHDSEEHENAERWLVSYADFITLLFAFFVVLYATSNQNIEKEKEFEESIRENMKLPAAMGAGAGGGAGDASTATLGSPTSGLESPSGANSKLANAADMQESLEKEITQKMTEDEKKIVTSLRHDMFGVRMSLAASSFFPAGSAKLKREALPTLDKIAQLLKSNQAKLLVEGHTDDQPLAPGSEFASNWELASARATQVVRYFTKVQQIPASRLAAVSYADQRPLAPNVDEASRSRNRRIEILVITADSPFDDF